jgi:hypothetical protein
MVHVYNNILFSLLAVVCEGGGSPCIEAQNARCIESSSVCNGVPDCSDGSDESNCTGICRQTVKRVRILRFLLVHIHMSMLVVGYM